MIVQRAVPFLESRAAAVVRDFGVVGAGAAGISAAIHARYEGFSVSVFDRHKARGGSFSRTPLIHNLPGFPVGVSGCSLSEGALQQLGKLGGKYFLGTEIMKISKVTERHFVLRDQNGKNYAVSNVILATGVAYRKLEVPGAEKLENKGIFYEVNDAIIEDFSKNTTPVVIYGAGNSAGQAALFYQSLGARVTIIHRGDNLEAHMSQYLIERISRVGINVTSDSEIAEVEGEDYLTHIVVKNRSSGVSQRIESRFLFAMIGGTPFPLPKFDFAKLNLDKRGYISVPGYENGRASFATSVPGVYAAGDITSVGAGRILLAQAQGVSAFIEASRAFRSDDGNS